MEANTIDDVVRRWRPTLLPALRLVIGRGFGRLGDCGKGEAQADMMLGGELAGLRTRARHINWRMRLLRRLRPDRDRAILVIASLPAERLRLAPGTPDDFHCFGE